jgi:hypothetical protein
MQQRIDSADLRRSALDLIASGNSPESVSDVLGVSVDTIVAWTRHEADPTVLALPIDRLPVHGRGVMPIETVERPALGDAQIGRGALLAYFGMATFGLIAGAMMLVINIRIVLPGPPRLDSLQRTDGTLSSRGSCNAPRHGGPMQDVIIQSATGTTKLVIPCLLSQAAFQQSHTRYITVFSDDRFLADHEVYEVDFDNVALYSYRDHAALERRVAPLTFLLSVMLTVLGLGFMYKLRQQWLRESDY